VPRAKLLTFEIDDRGRRMILIEVPREFFYAVKSSPGDLRMIAEAENGVAHIERPHRRRTAEEVEERRRFAEERQGLAVRRLLSDEGII
jgi:hypothetical protein